MNSQFLPNLQLFKYLNSLHFLQNILAFLFEVETELLD